MTINEKIELKKKLKKMIQTSELELIELEGLVSPIKPENSLGRISRMDAINNKSVAEAALRNKRNKLGKMKVALHNIEGPTFGICSLCKVPIPIQRLIYMPESTRCVRCADR